MAKLPLDLKNFKKHSSDEEGTHLMHKDGHMISIMHKPLSKEMRAALDALPATEHQPKDEEPQHLDEGGGVKYVDSMGKEKPKPHSSGWSSEEKEQFKEGYEGGSPLYKKIKGYFGGDEEPQNKADGGPISSSLMPGEDKLNWNPLTKNSSSIDQTEIPPVSPTESPSLDPSLQTKRSLYNSLVSGINDPKLGTPDADASQAQQFGPNGEPPKAFNAQAWNQAEHNYNQQQTQATAQNAVSLAKAMEDNKARQSAGLPPVMAPEGAARQPATPTIAPPAQMPAGTAPKTEDAFSQKASQGAFNKGVSQELAGINLEAAAKGAQGQAESKALEQSIADKQKIQSDWEKHSADAQTDINNSIADMKAQHIEPQTMFSNKSTLGQIGTGIGLLLGGMGGGLTHQENPVLKMINQQIDRDVEAQKLNMANTHNLVSAYQDKFKNVNDATNMAKALQASIVIDQLNQAAANAKTPMAKAAALQAAGQLYMDKVAPNLKSVGANQAIQQALSGANGDPNKINQAINAVAQVDPKQAEHLRERLVPGMGIANTEKDASTMKDLLGDSNGAKAAINRLRDINKISGKSMNPALRAEAYSLSRSLVGQLNRAFTGGGPMSAQEQELISQIAKNPTAFFALDSSNKKSLDTLEKTLNTKIDSAAAARGLRPMQSQQQSSGFVPKSFKPSK